MGSQANAGQSGQIAEEEEVRGDARIHPGSAWVVRLGEDVGQRQKRGQPEGGSQSRRPDVLAEPVALEAEVADTDRHEREGRIEDGDRVGNHESARQPG